MNNEFIAQPISSFSTIQPILKCSEAIKIIDRLCFQSLQTVVSSAIPAGGGFVPNISTWIVKIDSEPHITTSAQCLAALQDVERVIDRLYLTPLQSGGIPYGSKEPEHPKHMLDKLRKDFPDKTRNQISVLGIGSITNPRQIIENLSSNEF